MCLEGVICKFDDSPGGKCFGEEGGLPRGVHLAGHWRGGYMGALKQPPGICWLWHFVKILLLSTYQPFSFQISL